MVDVKEDNGDYVAPFDYWVEWGIPRKRMLQAIRKGELHIEQTPEGVPGLASAEVKDWLGQAQDWFTEEDARDDTSTLSPDDVQYLIERTPYLRWLHRNRPDLFRFVEMQVIENASTARIARKTGCSVKGVNAALDEARKAYDAHVAARKLGRYLPDVVLPEDRRAIAEAIRTLASDPDARRPN